MGKPEKALEQKVIFQRKTKWADSGKLLARIRAGDGRDFLPVSYYLEEAFELSFNGGRDFSKRSPGYYMDEVRSGHVKWLFYEQGQTAIVDAPAGKRRLFLFPAEKSPDGDLEFKVKTLMRNQIVYGVLWKGDRVEEIFYQETDEKYLTTFKVPSRYLSGEKLKFSAHLTVRPAANEWDARFIGRDRYDTNLVFPKIWGDNYMTSQIDENFLKEELLTKKRVWRYWLRIFGYFNSMILRNSSTFLCVGILKYFSSSELISFTNGSIISL